MILTGAQYTSFTSNSKHDQTHRKISHANSVYNLQCAHTSKIERIPCIFFCLAWLHTSLLCLIFMCFNPFMKTAAVWGCVCACVYFFKPEKKFAHDLTYNKHKRKTNNVYIWVVIIVSISVSESFALVMNDKPQFKSR